MSQVSDVEKTLLYPEKINIDSLKQNELKIILRIRSVPFNEGEDANVLKTLFREFILPRNQRKYRPNFLGTLMAELQKEKCGGEPSTEEHELNEIDEWLDNRNTLQDNIGEKAHEPMEISTPSSVLKRPSMTSLDLDIISNPENDTTPEELTLSVPVKSAKKFKPITYP